TNNYGLVHLAIGTGTLVSGSFTAINWAAGPYFIQVSVGGTVLSTVQLLSVPYAMYADVAGTVDSFSYTKLTGVPATFPGTWATITGIPAFAKVATTGSYTDLLNLPTLFNGAWSSLTGTPTTLAGYGITDALSSSSVAAKITATDTANWTTAFKWGNPNTAGYAVAANYYTKTNLQTATQAMVAWGNLTGTPTTLAGYGITDFVITTPVANQLLVYNGTHWVNQTPGYVAQQLTLTGNQLSISGGNSVTFAGWQRDSLQNVTLTGIQTITGNKT